MTDKRYCAITLEAEAWLGRIKAVVDDYGNTLADPTLLRNAVAGRRHEVTLEQSEKWVEELLVQGLVVRYLAEGELYLHVPNFEQEQPAGKNGKRIQRHPIYSKELRVNPGESKEIPVNAGESGTRVNPGASSASDTHTHTHNQEREERGESAERGERGDADPLIGSKTSKSLRERCKEVRQ